jgi:hypothetical protein
METQHAGVNVDLWIKRESYDVARPVAPSFIEENLANVLLFSGIVLPIIGILSAAMYLSSRAAGIAP